MAPDGGGHSASIIAELLTKITHSDLFVHYDHVVMSVFVMTILLVMVKTASKLSLVPGTMQQFNELIFEGFSDMLHDNIEHGAARFVPFIGTLGLFILLCNWFGLVPFFSGATANINVPLGCALAVFLVYNFVGIKEHGIGYVKQFWGPIWWLGPLMLPIELISHVARPLSLTLRLFGNMTGEHITGAVFLGMVPLLIPIAPMYLGIFVGFLQAFVFITLAIIYIAGSVAHDH